MGNPKHSWARKPEYLLFLALTGCLSDPESLDGSWAAQTQDGTEGVGLQITGQSYGLVWLRIQKTDEGMQYLAQLEKGHLVEQDSLYRFVPEVSSCPLYPNAPTLTENGVSIVRDGDDLQIVLPSLTLDLVLNTSIPFPVTFPEYVIGCFGGPDGFYGNPFLPAPVDGGTD